MTTKMFEKKLSGIGFDLNDTEKQVLQLGRVKSLIENMTEGELNTFAYNVKMSDGLIDALRDLDFIIEPIEYDVIEIQGNQIIVSNDIIDTEADTIFVIDKDYLYEVYDTTFDCADDENLYFDVIDEDDHDIEDEDETYANIEIELYREDGQDYVYLSNDGSSGCKYKYGSREELKKHINDYIDDLFV